jgi:polyhydroxybutyrate depolymerase
VRLPTNSLHRRSLLALVLAVVGLLVGLIVFSAHPAVDTGPRFDPQDAPVNRGALARSAAAGLQSGSMAPLTGVPRGWVTAVHRFPIGGITRSYLTVRPAQPSPRVLPVVVVLHGRGETPAAIERLTGFPAVTGPAILVYPAGYGRSWDAGGCCGVAHRARVDDTAFIQAVVQQVLATQPDSATTDVYLIGFSNGARLAYQLACQAPGRWAGIGAVEAVPATTCPSTTPVPIVIVANPRDPFFNLTRAGTVVQGYHEVSVDDVVAEWRRLDGCVGSPSVRRLGITTAESWDTCQGQGEVTYALYGEPGHFWPTELAAAPGASNLVWSLLRYDRVPTVEAHASR